MSGLPAVLASLAAGAVLGAVYFGGLWLTVDGLERARRPALRMLASLAVRLGLALATFCLLARHGGWAHVLAAAAGFSVLRLAVVRRAAPRRPGREAP